MRITIQDQFSPKNSYETEIFTFLSSIWNTFKSKLGDRAVQDEDIVLVTVSETEKITKKNLNVFHFVFCTS